MKSAALLLTRQALRVPPTTKTPALQESRQNHTSAASGVAYADSRGAINLLNWTDVGPRLTVDLVLRQL